MHVQPRAAAATPRRPAKALARLLAAASDVPTRPSIQQRPRDEGRIACLPYFDFVWFVVVGTYVCVGSARSPLAGNGKRLGKV